MLTGSGIEQLPEFNQKLFVQLLAGTFHTFDYEVSYQNITDKCSIF